MTINNNSTFDLHLEEEEYKMLNNCVAFLEQFLRDGYEDADYIENTDDGSELYRNELQAARDVIEKLGNQLDSYWERF